jgi:hypothetical protein
MATEALDFKKLNSTSGRMMRILRSHGKWAALYTERMAEIGDMKGAIVFPEQILSLNQSTLFAVSVVSKDDGKALNLHTRVSLLEDLTLAAGSTWSKHPYRVVEKFDEIIAIEKENPEDTSLFSVGGPGRHSSFNDSRFFTNGRAAVRYAEKIMSKHFAQAFSGRLK